MKGDDFSNRRRKPLVQTVVHILIFHRAVNATVGARYVTIWAYNTTHIILLTNRLAEPNIVGAGVGIDETPRRILTITFVHLHLRILESELCNCDL